MDISNLSKSGIFKWALIAAIIIVLNLFYIFSIKLIYNEPHHEDFCKEEQVRIVPQNQEDCLVVGGQWVEDRFIQRGFPRPERLEPALIEKEDGGYCNEQFTCRQEYQDARKLHERNVFVALVILGTLTLIWSFVLRSFEVVATALSFGGVLTLIIASIRYWSDMEDYLRVIVLGIALATLIWIGVKKFTHTFSDPPSNTSHDEDVPRP